MTQEPSIYKPLLHRDGHPGAAFFGKEDAVVTDLSSIVAEDIRNRISQFQWNRFLPSFVISPITATGPVSEAGAATVQPCHSTVHGFRISTCVIVG